MDEKTQKNREFRKRVLDRIASDPEFRRQLVDDPKAALEKAGFVTNSSDNDVSGYGYGMGDIMPPVFGGISDPANPWPVPPVPAPGPVPDPVIYPGEDKKKPGPAPDMPGM